MEESKETVTAWLPGDTVAISSSESGPMDSEKDGRDARKSAVAGIHLNLPIYPFEKAIMSLTRLYFPKRGDVVVGIVAKTYSAGYLVEINSSFYGNLPSTAFNKATQQNRPRLVIGSIVVAQVSSTGNEAIEAGSPKVWTDGTFWVSRSQCELTCETRDKCSWSSEDAYLGEVKRNEGYCFTVSIVQAISLQAHDCYVIQRLGEILKFEIAVGINGRVWVRGVDALSTVIVYQVITQSLGLTMPQIEAKIRIICNRFNINVKSSERLN